MRISTAGYTVQEASRITGVRPSTIRYWASPWGSLLQADVANPARQGARRLFSIRNLVQIRIAFLLSDAGWPQSIIGEELPRLLRPRLDWFNPNKKIWGTLEWILFTDRRTRGRRPWTILSVGTPGDPNQPHAGFVAALSAHLGDFEVTTITWPQGWQPRTDVDRHNLEQLVGTRRLTIVNLGQVKTRIAALLGHAGDPTVHAEQ